MSIILHTKNTKQLLNTLIRLAALSDERPMDIGKIKNRGLLKSDTMCFMSLKAPFSWCSICDSEAKLVSLNDFQTHVGER